MEPVPEKVALDDIDFESSPKVRHCVRTDVVSEYAEMYSARRVLPQPVLFKEQKSRIYLIADGLHRLLAVKASGLPAIMCHVIVGTPTIAFGMRCARTSRTAYAAALKTSVPA